MGQSSNRVVAALLTVLIAMSGLNMILDHYNTSLAVAGGGGGVDGSEGWIAFSGQKADGPETIVVMNTSRGKSRQVGKYNFNDNGPRLAVYQVSSQGKLKLTSMRNVGADLDVYIDALYPDSSGPSVREVKNQTYEAAEMGDKPTTTTDEVLPVPGK